MYFFRHDFCLRIGGLINWTKPRKLWDKVCVLYLNFENLFKVYEVKIKVSGAKKAFLVRGCFSLVAFINKKSGVSQLHGRLNLQSARKINWKVKKKKTNKKEWRRVSGNGERWDVRLELFRQFKREREREILLLFIDQT